MHSFKSLVKIVNRSKTKFFMKFRKFAVNYLSDFMISCSDEQPTIKEQEDITEKPVDPPPSQSANKSNTPPPPTTKTNSSDTDEGVVLVMEDTLEPPKAPVKRPNPRKNRSKSMSRKSSTSSSASSAGSTGNKNNSGRSRQHSARVSQQSDSIFLCLESSALAPLTCVQTMYRL